MYNIPSCLLPVGGGGITGSRRCRVELRMGVDEVGRVTQPKKWSDGKYWRKEKKIQNGFVPQFQR